MYEVGANSRNKCLLDYLYACLFANLLKLAGNAVQPSPFLPEDRPISYGLPVKPGMPLKADYLDADDDPHFYLDTFKLNRTQVPASEFELPLGLKQATEFNAVFPDTKAAGAELLF